MGWQSRKRRKNSAGKVVEVGLEKVFARAAFALLAFALVATAQTPVLQQCGQTPMPQTAFSESFNSLDGSKWKVDGGSTAAASGGELSISSSTPHRYRAIGTVQPIRANGNKTRITMLVRRDSAAAWDGNQPQFNIWFLRSANNVNSEGPEAGSGYRMQLCEAGTNANLWKFENGGYTELWGTGNLGGCARDAYHNITIDIDFNAPTNNIQIYFNGVLKASATDKTYAANLRESYFSYGMGYTTAVRISELEIIDFAPPKCDLTAKAYGALLQPMSLWGRIYGANNASAVNVTAYVGGQLRGVYKIRSLGRYGIFDVKGKLLDEGKELELRVNGNPLLKKTAVFRVGGTKRMDLSS